MSLYPWHVSAFFTICIFFILFFFFIKRLIGLVGKVFANGPRDLGSIPGRVIPKTLKMVLDNSLLNTQHYKVHIKGKVSINLNSAFF